MKIIQAKSAGMCWGVVRAIEIARNSIPKENKIIYTDGPLIHNRQMMLKLRSEGIHEATNVKIESDIKKGNQPLGSSSIVIRAHGISPQRRKYLKGLGLSFKDATCPDVGMIAGKIRLHVNRGYNIVIFGDPTHPETVGLIGYAGDRGYVIQSSDHIDQLPELGSKVCMVSQSTMFTHEFEEHACHLKQLYPDVLVFNTICQATKNRQSSVITLVQAGAEAIIVIGGRHSANTKKLAELARIQDIPTFHIERALELNMDELRDYKIVGLTAGASTPDFLILEVRNFLESFKTTKLDEPISP